MMHTNTPLFNMVAAWKRGALGRKLIKELCDEYGFQVTFHANGDISIHVLNQAEEGKG